MGCPIWPQIFPALLIMCSDMAGPRSSSSEPWSQLIPAGLQEKLDRTPHLGLLCLEVQCTDWLGCGSIHLPPGWEAKCPLPFSPSLTSLRQWVCYFWAVAMKRLGLADPVLAPQISGEVRATEEMKFIGVQDKSIWGPEPASSSQFCLVTRMSNHPNYKAT